MGKIPVGASQFFSEKDLNICLLVYLFVYLFIYLLSIFIYLFLVSIYTLGHPKITTIKKSYIGIILKVFGGDKSPAC